MGEACSFFGSIGPKISIGTAQFGLNYGISNVNGQIQFDEAQEIIKYAKANGVRNIDTAIAYGNSEEVLGRIGVDGLEVFSKLPSIPNDCSNLNNWLVSQVSDSLLRLRISKLTGLLLHKSSDLFGPYGPLLIDCLESLKKSKLVDKIGVSIYNPSELHTLSSLIDLDVVQCPFSVFDDRLNSTGWMNRLYSMDIDLQVRSIFLQGLLLMSPEDRPPYFNKWKLQLNVWDRYIEQSGVSAFIVCLGHALKQEKINKIVVGVDSFQQFTQIIDAGKSYLDVQSIKFNIDDEDLLNPSLWRLL
jgi:aryl-alcohol dehydrogenase-like predicted oxidoreductase